MKSTWIARLALASGVIGVATLAYAYSVERARVRLDHYDMLVDVPSLLPSDELTILHISDLHMRRAGRVQKCKLAALRRLIAQADYDLALVTGDLIHDAAGFPVALDLLGGLQPRLGAFCVPGNHDYVESSAWGVIGTAWAESGDGGFSLSRILHATRSLAHFARKVLRNERVHQPIAFNDVPAMHAALAARGVQPLVNRAVHLSLGAEEIWLAGVDDLMEGRPDLPAALASVPAGAPLILMAHNPDVWLEPLANRAILVLAGHTHGGQVRMPLLGAAHTQGTHLSRRHAAGWFRRADGPGRMFVSRGAGESLPLRLGVPPQIALIRLVKHLTI